MKRDSIQKNAKDGYILSPTAPDITAHLINTSALPAAEPTSMLTISPADCREAAVGLQTKYLHARASR